MNISPPKPKNAEDLKKLLQQYEKILTPQNKQFINELINKLESNADRNELQELAGRMRKATIQNKK